VFDTWLRDVFGLREFRKGNDQYVHIEPVVVCTFGEVRFDYVGSLEHPVYMAVGDRITFAKQISSHSEPVPTDLMREVLRFGLTRDRRDYREAPILLSQSAYAWVADLVRPSPNGPGQTVDEPHYVKLPARSAIYPVYALWPENIEVV
jgi:hypothetical protein